MNLKFDNVKISARDSPGKASAGLDGSISEDFSQASMREMGRGRFKVLGSRGPV
jgi:hypothetical protein